MVTQIVNANRMQIWILGIFSWFFLSFAIVTQRPLQIFHQLSIIRLLALPAVVLELSEIVLWLCSWALLFLSNVPYILDSSTFEEKRPTLFKNLKTFLSGEEQYRFVDRFVVSFCLNVVRYYLAGYAEINVCTWCFKILFHVPTFN